MVEGAGEQKNSAEFAIKQITVYTNATLEVTYNAGYLSNQTRALDYTPYEVLPRVTQKSISKSPS